MTKLEAALNLAKRGFHVFPVKPNSKIAGITDYPNKASHDPEQIKKWWSNGHADSNIGISTTHFNESEALLVVDVDQKEGKMGENELLRLEIEGKEFPPTLEQTTPSGGRHLIYKTKTPVKQGVNVLARGIDIRSRGGYIVGPWSRLGDREYVLNDREIAWAPDWLVSYCGRSITKPDSGPAPTTHSINRENAESRARHYLNHEAPQAVQGAGGDQTTFAVAARVKDFGVDQLTCFNLLESVWNDKNSPPWTTAELALKVENAYRYGTKPQGADAPEAVFTKIVEPAPSPELPKSPKKRGLRVKLFHEINPSFNQQYLVENFLSPGAMSVVYGESGGGKTFFALDLSLHVALNRPWREKRVEGGAVIYVAAEGGFGIQKRIKAFRKYHNIEQRTDVPFALVDSAIDLKKDTSELIDLVKQVEMTFNTKCALIVFDTLARVMGDGNENDAKDMGALIANIDAVRTITKAHVMTIHHSGKDVARGMRGHSSLKAAVDSEILIEGETAKVRKQRDMDHAKEMQFRLEQVELGEDPAGTKIYSCVVLPANTSAASDFSKLPLDPTSLQGKGLRALQNALDWHPHPAPDELELPEDAVIASLEDWRNAFYELAYPDKPKKKYHYEAFNRMSAALIKSGHVKINAEFAWLT